MSQQVIQALLITTVAGMATTVGALIGLIVPKHGHRIVERNLVKRRLREIGRRLALPRFDEVGVHLDLLLRARRSAYGLDFGILEGEVTTVVEGLCSRSS